MRAVASVATAAGFTFANAAGADAQRHVFSANPSSGDVSVYELGPDGALIRLPNSTREVGVIPSGLGASPDGSSLYVSLAGEDKVAQLPVAADGTLGDPTKASTGASPGPIATSLEGRYVYVADTGAATISRFIVDAAGHLIARPGGPIPLPGAPADVVKKPYFLDEETPLYVSFPELDELGMFSDRADGPPYLNQLATGDEPTALEMTQNSEFLYVLNAGDGTVSGFNAASLPLPTELPGSPWPAPGAVDMALAAVPTSPGTARYTGPQPTDHRLYVSSADGRVFSYRTAPNGSLVPLGATVAGPGSGAGQLAVDGDGGRLIATRADGALVPYTAGPAGVAPGLSGPIARGGQGAGGPLLVRPSLGPDADLVAETIPGTRTVGMSAAGSTDPDGIVETFLYDFRDGTDPVTAGSSVRHRYPAADIFYPELRVADDDGCSNETLSAGHTVSCLSASTNGPASQGQDAYPGLIDEPVLRVRKLQRQSREISLKGRLKARGWPHVTAKGVVRVEGKRYQLRSRRVTLEPPRWRDTFELTPKPADSRRIAAVLRDGGRGRASVRTRFRARDRNEQTRRARARLVVDD